MTGLTWKIGVEVELLAPAGSSRKDLADAIAVSVGGNTRRIFHPESEPSLVPGAAIFENLTLGFDVTGPDGALVARCLDDLTLQSDLDRQRPPIPDWYRIAGDDKRLMRLIKQNADPTAPVETVLDPVAALFGTETEVNEAGMVRLADETGAAIAIAAPLPGERERPCELVTPPLETDHASRLEALLSIARDLGFTVPVEAAAHIHFDGEKLTSAAAIANLVRLFAAHGAALKRLVGANPNCLRLGAWPEELLALVNSVPFLMRDWNGVRMKLAEIEDLTKYCDFNIFNLVHNTPGKHTFEVRILPSGLETGPIIEMARLFEAMLDWVVDAGTGLRKVPADLPALVDELTLEGAEREMWRARLAADPA